MFGSKVSSRCAPAAKQQPGGLLGLRRPAKALAIQSKNPVITGHEVKAIECGIAQHQTDSEVVDFDDVGKGHGSSSPPVAALLPEGIKGLLEG